MKQTTKFYMGIDVSKPYFDLSLMTVINHQKQPVITKRFDNTAAGIKALHKWLKEQHVSFNEHSLLVIENTGIYHRLIWQFCSDNSLPLHIGNAAHYPNGVLVLPGVRMTALTAYASVTMP